MLGLGQTALLLGDVPTGELDRGALADHVLPELVELLVIGPGHALQPLAGLQGGEGLLHLAIALQFLGMGEQLHAGAYLQAVRSGPTDLLAHLAHPFPEAHGDDATEFAHLRPQALQVLGAYLVHLREMTVASVDGPIRRHLDALPLHEPGQGHQLLEVLPDLMAGGLHQRRPAPSQEQAGTLEVQLAQRHLGLLQQLGGGPLAGLVLHVLQVLAQRGSAPSPGRSTSPPGSAGPPRNGP